MDDHAFHRAISNHMWQNSLARGRLGVEIKTALHKYAAGQVQLWWGPVLPIERNSIIHYFDGPFGVTLEWVDPPRTEERQ